MRHFALSAIGRDRPGIVAAVTEALLAHEGNIEDSQMAILRGHFAMTLIVSAPGSVDAAALQAALARIREALDLEAVSLSEVTEVDPELEPSPSHIVSVYGVDHPGIVHAIAGVLAAHGVTITDLATRLVEGEPGKSVYSMMIEIALPQGLEATALEAALREAGERQQVELSFRELEQDAL
jgi:glycine cleavage system transcriptional repressor